MAWMIAAAVALLLAAFIYLQNDLIVVSRYRTYTNKPIGGFRVVQLSDLHNKRFGRGNSRLIKKTAAEAPDMIVITGDLVSRWTKDYAPMTDTVRALSGIAPVFYTAGNQEYGRPDFEALFGGVAAAGATVLREKFCEAMPGVFIAGVDEVGYSVRTTDFLKEFEKTEGYKLIISHYADYSKEYQMYDADLVLTGHAHGGQVILPFVGGLYTSTQGLFPVFYRGMTKRFGTYSIISRGLGNSRFPLRVFNHPEIVVADVISSKDR